MRNERISMLKGKRGLLMEQRDGFLAQYDMLTNAIDVAERAKPYFVTLKDATDQEAVELYSELLTNIVHDVMQDYEQEICLSTAVVRNKTTLEIKTIKNGEIENIDDGRGGSISNLISAGLRFIALYKSTNRRFIVLDEPECWLAPDLIPRFVSVIEKMSDLIGIQTVLISHHASDVISSENSQVITIAHNKADVLNAIVNPKAVIAAKPSVVDLSLSKTDDDAFSSLSSASPVGIASIRLYQVQSHTDTTINLGCGLTVINGNNDIGKSVIARSLSALLVNDFKDQLIQHGKDQAFLELLTEQGIIKWSFKRKAKTSLYQFIVDGEILHEQDAKRGEIPTFLNDILAMPLVNNINIHVADQRDPLFILHPSHSPAQRAEMLNLGDSFKQLQIMMQLHDEQLRENRKMLKHNKEQIDSLNDKLFYLSRVDDVADLSQRINECVVTSDAEHLETIQLLESASTLDTYQSTIDKMTQLLSDWPIEDTHDDLIERLSTGSFVNERVLSDLERLMSNLDSLELHDEHSSLLAQIEQSQINFSDAVERVALCLHNLTFINTRELPDFDVSKFSQLHDSIHQQDTEIACLEKELTVLLEMKAKYQVCPTCGRAVDNHDEHTDAFSDFEAVHFSAASEIQAKPNTFLVSF